MTDASGEMGAGSLNLTTEEKRVFGQLFRQADTENIGVVTGEVAVKFFEKTRLEPAVLGEIWQIADKENRGLLTPAGFGIVLRLIGHYQAGRDPTQELAFRPGPLPKFDGLGPSALPPPPGPPPGAIQPQLSGGPIRVPPLTPEKVNQYAALFEKSGAQDGILPGEQAKQIFEKAGLPNEVLGRIWNLADTEQRGVLVLPEFIIAMHLLASFKSGSLRALPSILPAGLYEAATRRAPPRQLSGAVSGPSSLSAIPRQFSGASGGRAGSPLGRTTYIPATQAPQTSGQSNDWVISPLDKAQFDGIYMTIDKANRGFITGEEAVPFFSNSKLPEEVLAQIWDLADISSQGRLSRDEFAVAMYLIRQQRSKLDGRDLLPSSLPPNLVPPSMRNQIRPPTQATAPVFESPSQPMPKSAADDLFGLDALSTPPASTQVPVSTGGSTSFGDPFSNTRTPMTPSSPTHTSSPIQPSTTFKQFVPSSNFGQTLAHNATGGSNTSASVQQSRLSPLAVEDLLGDNDPEVSKKLTKETTELANLSNHVGTLSKQMQEVQGQRTTSQNELNQASAQKREFELRLSQLRGMYEQEVKDVRSLQDRLTTSRGETKKLQQDIAIIEGTHQDLQNQHRQIIAALQADQQENTNLKDRMRVLNAEIAQMKPQLEKLKSEARQQKGLVAINKKQLSTNEGERDKLKAEADELAKSNEENSRAIAATSQAQGPAPIASPALSTMSATNPFFRRQTSISSESSPSPFARSPPPGQQTDRSFENVFGPSYSDTSLSQETGALPPTTFKQEIDGPHDVPSPAIKTSLPIRSIDNSGVVSPAISQPGLHSRDVSGQSEPPPPPESRQISSSFLPFPQERENSLSSSRQVSAPASRFGESSTTSADTPTSHSGTTPTGQPLGGSMEGVTGMPLALDRNSSTSPTTSDTRSSTNPPDSMPGAFPGEASKHNFERNTGGSTVDEASVGADPFVLSKERPRTPTAARDDFDAAFAGFGGPSAAKDRQITSSPPADGPPNVISHVNAEFPPLRELEHDDDDSDTSDEHGGFEDDFTSASPGHSRKESAVDDQLNHVPSRSATDATGGPFAPRPSASQAASALSMSADPPAAGAQAAPPVYDQIVSPKDKARAEVDQYSGLLPIRHDSTSPTQPREQSFSSPIVTGGQALFGSLPKSTTTQPAPLAKAPFDDFDNDFDDLEDAKEGDPDDDFANISAHERSGAIDFDPTFDSPAASKTSQHTAQGSSGFGGDSNGFGDFTQSPTASQSTSGLAAASTADSHDWDAIFAGLDAPSSVANEPGTSPSIKDTGTSSIAKINGTSASAISARPQFGRALTEAGEHDDPILKDLTAMGYTRKDALTALEKYDYNLERAANYLASQS